MTTKIAIRSTSDSAWVSITDLMSGLMIIFLFVAIAYMKNVSNIADDWLKTKKDINTALIEEFRDDLSKWDAEIIQDTLAIRSTNPVFYLG